MRLRYTKEAVSELAQVLADIAEHSPPGARRVRSRIRKTVGLLSDHPYSGQRTSSQALRRIVVAPYPYLIFYRVDAKEVVIIGIRHAARDPATMPKPDAS